MSEAGAHALVEAAAARVVRWERVPETWAGHRPEPLAAQRLWACGVEGEGPRQAGFDAQGRAVLVGPADRPPAAWGAPPDWVDVVERSADGREVVVTGLGRMGARRAVTALGADGRARTTRHGDDAPQETYNYDDAGRVTAIEESPGVMALTPAPWRAQASVGGRLEVAFGGDGDGPVAIRHAASGAVVWERLAVPWPEARDAFGRAVADAAAAGLAASSLRPSDAVFALALVVVPSWAEELQPLVFAGLEATRRRLVDDPAQDPNELEEYLWWLQAPDDAAGVSGGVDLSSGFSQAALRAAAMHDPGDPHQVIGQAAVGPLAARDWSAVFTATADFVAYRIGDDVDASDLYASMQAANPPERLTERAARWRGSPYPPS